MIDRGELLRKLALNAARFSGLGTLAGRFIGSVGSILMLHRVTDEPSLPLGINRHLSITPGFLDAVLSDLRKAGCRFVSMDEALDRLRARTSSERFVTITADDGYRDNLLEALPVLERHEAPVTVFVAPGLVDGVVDLWWDVLEEIVTAADRIELPLARGTQVIRAVTAADKVRAYTLLHDHLTTEVPEVGQADLVRALARAAGVDAGGPSRRTLMDWTDIGRLAYHPLATIGAHTVHHYNLKRLDAADALAEMRSSADRIAAELGVRPAHFAYPYGYVAAVGQREVALAAEAGFASAVTTRHGVLRPEHAGHCQALPRISLNGRYQEVAHIRTMVNGVTTLLVNRGRALVTV